MYASVAPRAAPLESQNGGEWDDEFEVNDDQLQESSSYGFDSGCESVEDFVKQNVDINEQSNR